jgi:hypothetical protein
MGELARSVHQHGGTIFGAIPRALVDRELAYGPTDELVVTDTLRDRNDTFRSSFAAPRKLDAPWDRGSRRPQPAGSGAGVIVSCSWPRRAATSAPVAVSHAWAVWSLGSPLRSRGEEEQGSAHADPERGERRERHRMRSAGERQLARRASGRYDTADAVGEKDGVVEVPGVFGAVEKRLTESLLRAESRPWEGCVWQQDRESTVFGRDCAA